MYMCKYLLKDRKTCNLKQLFKLNSKVECFRVELFVNSKIKVYFC